MSVNQLSSDKNAERVCIHKLKFTIGRTILSAICGHLPASVQFFEVQSLNFGRQIQRDLSLFSSKHNGIRQLTQ